MSIKIDKKTALYILNLNEEYTQKELKEHYRKFIKTVHPDTSQADEHLFKIIKEAYDLLLEEVPKEISIVDKKRAEFRQKQEEIQPDINIDLNNNSSNTTTTTFSFKKNASVNETLNTSSIVSEKIQKDNIDAVKVKTTIENQNGIERKTIEIQRPIGNKYNTPNENQEIKKDNSNSEDLFRKVVREEIDKILSERNISDMNAEKDINTIKNKNNFTADNSSRKTDTTNSDKKVYFTIQEIEFLAKNGFVEKKIIKNKKEQGRVRFLATEVFANLSGKYYLKDYAIIENKTSFGNPNFIDKQFFEGKITPYGIFIDMNKDILMGKNKISVKIDKYNQIHKVHKKLGHSQYSFMFKINYPEMGKIFSEFEGIFIKINFN